MNEQTDNSLPLSLSQALEQIKDRDGKNFSKEKVNLAELGYKGSWSTVRANIAKHKNLLPGSLLCNDLSSLRTEVHRILPERKAGKPVHRNDLCLQVYGSPKDSSHGQHEVCREQA